MKTIAIFLIRFIRFAFPLFSRLAAGSILRAPQYALEAVKKYGFLKGTYLATKRLLKCHPFHKGGYDPVP